MRRRPVRLSENAISDLIEIARYIAKASTSSEIALQYVDRIEQRCNKIGEAPLGGVSRPDLGDGIRLVPFEKSAVILYRVTDSGVEIVNIFRKGRNYTEEPLG